MPVISALGRLREQGHKFKDSLSYVVRPSLKKKKKGQKKFIICLLKDVHVNVS
jgi:hypothetical protein